MPAQRLEAFCAASSTSPAAQASVVLLAPQGSPPAHSEALLQLVLRQALDEIALSEEAASLWFWRERAATAAERLAAERTAARGERAARDRLERAAATALKLPLAKRWAGLGRLFAASGPFAVWVVAVGEDSAARVAAASSPALAAELKLDERSALYDAMRRRVTIVRGAGVRRGSATHEDRMFKDFAAYLCVPFKAGAVALATNKALEAARERVEALASRLGPLTTGWAAAERATRLRALVRELSVRLFTAADAERARIARDLHDDHAQLLAAARIALEGDREKARGIFQQLESDLRQRIRQLRPATLGDRRLSVALRGELARLTAAGIRTRISGVAMARGLPSDVQQVCDQAAREALANILRHAHATRAEVRIERDAGAARLVITDDGRGIEPGASSYEGAGLKGLAERLDLVGGAMRIESRRGMTRLIAEIPLN
jgi:signal transduction histidine kinase